MNSENSNGYTGISTYRPVSRVARSDDSRRAFDPLMVTSANPSARIDAIARSHSKTFCTSSTNR